eukprot:11319167-Ditylum_brightwellii.AAC.1
MSKKTFYNQVSSDVSDHYQHKKRKVYKIEKAELQRAYVVDFCHSKDASRIDTNLYRCIDVRGNNGEIEKHVGRVWNVPTVRKQYSLFKQSATVAKYKEQYGNNFTKPGITFFFYKLCKCVKDPTRQSCVDIPMSGLKHIMGGLHNYLSTTTCMRKNI